MFGKKYSYLFLVVLVLLFAGCRGGSKVVTQAEDFDFQEMRQSAWAVGGVVLNSKFVPDGAAEKELKPLVSSWNGVSAAFSPMLYGGFLSVAPEMEIWTYDTVLSLVPENELKEFYNQLAIRQKLSTAQLNNISAYLPGVRYLVFARLDDTDLVTQQGGAASALDQRNRDGREPHANVLTRTVTIGRGVFMSMEAYDLENGAMIWSGEADSWDEKILSGDSNLQSKGIKLVSEEEDAEVSKILLDGTMRDGPSLTDGVRNACGKLAEAIKWGPKEVDSED